VGQYGSGNQFMPFVTWAFQRDWWSGNRPPEYLRERWAEHKRWYAVLHRFDPGGEHLGTEARARGTTAKGEGEAIARAHRELAVMLASVTPFHSCDIRVRPFGVEIDGYFFGLVYQCVDAEDPDDPSARHECVMLEPSDIMFHPPWDSGEYST
jgi:formate hydrogenlyase regulatory protein HycA